MWITACCVLHNLLLDMKDDWERHKRWWTVEEEEEHDEELLLLSQEQERRGLLKREQTKEFVLEKRILEI